MSRALSGRLEQLDMNVSDYACRVVGTESPLRCEMLNFSLDGNSSIAIANFALNTFCASSNTSLNWRAPVSPKTFALTSALLMGMREYSHASARRTSFFTIVSMPVAV